MSFSLLLNRGTSKLAPGLAYAPVPPEEDKGFADVLWLMASIVMAALVIFLIYKVLGGSKDKTRR